MRRDLDEVRVERLLVTRVRRETGAGFEVREVSGVVRAGLTWRDDVELRTTTAFCDLQAEGASLLHAGGGGCHGRPRSGQQRDHDGDHGRCAENDGTAAAELRDP